LIKLQKQNEKLHEACNENDLKYAVLDERFSQLSEEKLKLKAELQKKKMPQFTNVM